MVAKGKASSKLVRTKSAKIRTQKDMQTRAAADRYARATQRPLPASHRWLLRTDASFEDISRASASLEVEEDYGLVAVRGMAAATYWFPDRALVQLDGQVDPSTMSTLPNDVLYVRMSEFEALAEAARAQVELLFEELRRRNAFHEEVVEG